ncbi:hypothetical protein [Solidesulfovibrio sp.]
MSQRPFAGALILVWLSLCPVAALAQDTAQEALDALDSALESPPGDEAAKGGWLGLIIQGVDANTAGDLGLGNAKGALVASVLTGVPADKAGVKRGDVIEEYAEARGSRGGRVSYKVLKKAWFVVSGLDGADIWCRKPMDAGG